MLSERGTLTGMPAAGATAAAESAPLAYASHHTALPVAFFIAPEAARAAGTSDCEIYSLVKRILKNV